MTADEKADLQQRADIDRASAIEAATNKEYMSAAFHTAAALKKYQRLNNSERIQELKALLVEYNSKAPPLASHKVSVPITEEMAEGFDRIISTYTDQETLKENLLAIVKSRVLLPRLEQAKENAKEIRPVTAQLVTHMLLDDDGHTKSYDDFETTWLHQNYEIQMNLTHGLLDTSIKEDILNNIEQLKQEVSELEEELSVLSQKTDADRRAFMEFALGFIGNMVESFLSLTPEDVKKCKQIIFPAGFYVDANKSVYTPEISSLYRLATKKKDTEVSEISHLVPHIRRIPNYGLFKS